MPGRATHDGGRPDGARAELEGKILGAAKEALRGCDPLGLMALGCPDDEYDAEAEMLAAKIDDPFDVGRVAGLVKGILEETFGEPFGDERCRKIAEELGRILAKAGQGA